eukprot:403373871
MGKDKKLSAALNKTKVLTDEIKLRLQEQDQIFNTEDRGFIEVEHERERTLKVSQQQLKDILPVQSAQNIFDIGLNEFGPYVGLDVTRNGKNILLGGKKGHVSVLGWKKKDLKTEFHAKQLIRDVKFLHNEKMFAVAQKKYLHIYDSQGIELHCMRDHQEPKLLEFLPYHFLLVSASKMGQLKYLDVSIGQVIAEIKTKRGEPLCMHQNPQNAVISVGHNSGEVTMWTPNMGSTPVVKMLCHPSAPVLSLSMSRDGRYMVTTGKDSKFKIWDIRNTYQSVHTYFNPVPAITSTFSDTGLVGVGFGSEVQIWKNVFAEKQKAPYMKYKLANKSHVSKALFLPYEDVMGISHDQGYSSIVVPGAGEANFDAFEANPFETKKQRQEAEVHNLLQKLQSDTISLKVNTIGMVDDAAPEVKAKEQRELQDAQIEKMRKKDKKKNKMRGKGKIGREMENKTHQVHEAIRAKNKLQYEKEYKKAKVEQDMLQNDMEFLDKIDEKFDPLESYLISENKGNKRQRF